MSEVRSSNDSLVSSGNEGGSFKEQDKKFGRRKESLRKGKWTVST